jgi:uncharacterized Tic20 family protein
MSDEMTVSRDERMMAGLAHGSVLLGLVTNGVGGIGAALLIWLTQRGKSAYVAAQALQALVYQLVTLLLTMVFWCCWGGLWMLMIIPPIIANPSAYDNAAPPGMWVGLTLMIFPLGLMALTTLYGVWGAVRSMSGHDFRYAVIGNWLERQEAGQ